MIRFENAFLIEIDNSKKAKLRMNSTYPSSRYQSSPEIRTFVQFELKQLYQGLKLKLKKRKQYESR